MEDLGNLDTVETILQWELTRSWLVSDFAVAAH